MVLPAKWSKSTPDGWGAMGGFLLIFFPHPHSNSKKNHLLSLPPAPSPPFSGRLLSKTLSICSLFLFTTFLLFTLSTFEPSSALIRHRPPRRLLLSHFSPPFSLSAHLVKLFNSGAFHNGAVRHSDDSWSLKALQGMGILYRRGTRAMPDLLVAHVSHAVDHTEFRTFLRILHAGGLLARSDLVFVFSSPSVSSKLSPLIREENESLLKLVSRYDEFNRTTHNSRGLAGLARHLRTRRKDEKKESKEAIWGKGIRPTNQSELEESARTSYGSVVGFDASELDPENTLSGFLDHVPMGLRRWACYPMLLGRLRRSYKHVLLADVESVLVVSDPVARVRNRSPESVYLWAYRDPEPGKRGKRQPAKANHDPTIVPGIVAGGSRGVRRLSDAVLTEIVRAAIEHKGKAGKNTVTESGIVNQLVRGGHLLKNVNVINSAEPVWEAGKVFGSDSNAGSVYSSAVVVQRVGRGIDISRMRDSLWCWSDLHTEIYRDCLGTQ